ncbi:MAG: methyltransferase domain-containing protein [Acidimicrobiia bacterium]
MTSGVPDVAARGFSATAEQYEQYRPSYPADAVAWLLEHCRVTPGATVCDLGAGTGKFTRLLVGNGADAVAVEPLPEMLAILHRELPEVPAVNALAEAMPFASGTLHAITAAQAFHWFDLDRALAELHRVLVPGGRVGVIWNSWDDSVAWVRDVRDVMAQDASEQWLKNHLDDRWLHDALRHSQHFGDVHSTTFRQTHTAPRGGVREELVARMATSSHIAVKTPEEQKVVLDQVRAIIDAVDADDLDFPYRVDVYWFERRS